MTSVTLPWLVSWSTCAACYTVVVIKSGGTIGELYSPGEQNGKVGNYGMPPLMMGWGGAIGGRMLRRMVPHPGDFDRTR